MAYGTVNVDAMTTSDGYTSAGTYGFKNRIINGAMVIFQRGTAATTDASYSVDRWRLVKANDATESVSQNTDAPSNFSYSLRNTISVGDSVLASNQYSGFEQAIEGYNIADLGWGTANAKPITVSFWVRSSVTGTYVGNVRNSDASRISPFNFTISSSNTWEQKTITITGDTGGTWQTTTSAGVILAIYAALGTGYNGGTANTWGASPNYGCGSPVNGIASNGNIFAVSGVQLEKGSTATSFDYRPYGTELALCQRYFWVLSASNWSDPYCRFENVTGYSSSAGNFIAIFPVSMRASPTFYSSGASSYNLWNGTFYTVSGISISSYPTSGGLRCDLTVTASVTQGDMYHLLANGNNTAYYGFSSEL